MTTDDYKRGWTSGYYSGRRKSWTDYDPPNPPEEHVRALFIASKNLRDAALAVLQIIEPDDPIFLDMRRQAHGVDAAFTDISKWLKEPK